MRKLGRRAVSPLVATILLVALSIALGSFVMSISKGLTIQEESPKKSSLCPAFDEQLKETVLEKYNEKQITQEQMVLLRSIFPDELK
ncbi:hypothetical protein J4460_06150 [Candidatus Woesearchaeota archaeon]|nr:hypothetical protein [Candidatus Woesearchaeota archaeon]HIH37580.1 hypothetical protein [Candidatus Woesearchaeota archaeon]HIH47993.1 hypothetical protein [Candidatus Woesearchaeota archaeon]HIJ03679.1 hypothetical protein [Candidatus Woesearchaeota archaeon]